jgi:hypothetical protein
MVQSRGAGVTARADLSITCKVGKATGSGRSLPPGRREAGPVDFAHPAATALSHGRNPL